jgi:tRNA splicing endonuclease
MIEVFYVKNEYLVWDNDNAEELRRNRVFLLNDSLPIRLSEEQATLLCELNLAVIYHSIYSTPSEIHLHDYCSLKTGEMDDWNIRKLQYDEEMKLIFSQEPRLEKALWPTKPALPSMLEKTSARMGWIKKTAFGSPQTSQRSKIFRAFWNDGWWISDGLKFGGDFLLYAESPENCHSSFIVQIVSNGKLSSSELLSLSRLGSSVKKRAIFCYWNEDEQTVIGIMSRWRGS